MPFEFKNAQELGRVFETHGVKNLFFGKSGAILLGYSDTTQDVDLYIEKRRENCERAAAGLLELGFRLTENEQEEIRRQRFHSTSERPLRLGLDRCGRPI